MKKSVPSNFENSNWIGSNVYDAPNGRCAVAGVTGVGSSLVPPNAEVSEAFPRVSPYNSPTCVFTAYNAFAYES